MPFEANSQRALSAAVETTVGNGPFQIPQTGLVSLEPVRNPHPARIHAVSAMVATQNPDLSVEDVASLNLRLDNGAVGSVRAGYLLDPFPEYEDNDLMMAFEGSQGSLAYFPRGAPTLRLRTRAAGFAQAGETRTTQIQATRRGGYAYDLLAGFVEAVESGGAPPVTEEDAWYVLRVAEAAYQASRSGAEQKLTW